ncbi:hypothetical protein [Empedobacter brevis]|uniref:hypothetical protein n=1 Tax=Empedobacter brevis TaxID=247 RepID=UPI0028A99F59|nr:hypothetical protein [Empedobacter brevis]
MKTILYFISIISIQLLLFNCNKKSDGTTDVTEYQIIKEDFKLTNKNSSDEIALDNLNTYLKERNLDLCTFSQEIEDMESKTLKEADNKFPGFGMNHIEYLERIRDKERIKMSKKYNLNDSIYTYVNVFAMSYCK